MNTQCLTESTIRKLVSRMPAHEKVFFDGEENLFAKKYGKWWGGPEGRNTLISIYGNKVFFLNHGLEKLRKIALTIKIGTAQKILPLPRDAIFLERGSAQDLVIISKSTGKVTKACHGEYGFEIINREVNALRSVKDTVGAFSVPECLFLLCDKNDSSILVTELLPNSSPLVKERLFSQTLWQQFVIDNLGDGLRDMYLNNHFNKTPIQELANEVEYCLEVLGRRDVAHRFASESLQHICRSIVKRIEKNNFTQKIATARIHGDLKPEHIHRGGGKVSIIDWGLSSRGAVAIDFLKIDFDRFISEIAMGLDHSKIKNRLTKKEKNVEKFLCWQRKNLGIETIGCNRFSDFFLFFFVVYLTYRATLTGFFSQPDALKNAHKLVEYLLET